MNVNTRKIGSLAEAKSLVTALTTAQGSVFKICCDFWTANDQLPTMKVISERMGYRSANSAQEVMDALERKGLVERNEVHRFRFSRVEGMNIGEVFRHGASISIQ